MKVSLSWLQEYVNVDLTVPELAEALTMAGLEVEAVYDRYAYLSTVVVGRITAMTPHPRAADLQCCQVDTGQGLIAVVCGAPNARTGMLAPCALPSTCLPGGEEVKAALIRGERSEGMLCSQAELGLGPDAAGLMVLPADFAVGTSLDRALALSDTVLEIDLTPNRSDCLSIIGVAREVAAIQKGRVTYPRISLSESAETISDHTSVTILAPDECPRYAARLVWDVTVAPSPFWLQQRLVSVGLKPINNIVDVTNYVMMETGQPLHAFDFDQLAENRIVVRTAQKGERFTTLDQKERTLDPEMLMICDGAKPVALAGVMGGLNSEIEAGTTRVLLESAYFDPICIRKTAKKTGLNTDASHRFERGVDPQGTLVAVDRAAQLIAEISGGRVLSGIVDAHPKPFARREINLNIARLNRHLGIRLALNDVSAYLRSIEFDVQAIDDQNLRVVPPSCRVDIGRFEDLSEEVARLMGYNNIKTTFPLIPAEVRHPSKRVETRRQIKTVMTGLGFTEAINYSFIHKDSCDRLHLAADDFRRQVVEILNPLSEDQSIMRPSLIPGLLETAYRNLSMQNRTLKLFEVGNIFYGAGGIDRQPHEVEMLAGIWTGLRNEADWHTREVACDFFDLKGAVEELLRSLKIDAVEFERMPTKDCRYTRPGHTARVLVAGQDLGLVGEVHPKTLEIYNLKQSAYLFEINAGLLMDAIPAATLVKPLPKFPSTSRDITLILPREVEALKILKSIESRNEELIEKVFLFDVFEGGPVTAGKKSVSFRVTYRSYFETLEDEAVNQLHRTITDRLLAEFEADLPA